MIQSQQQNFQVFIRIRPNQQQMSYIRTSQETLIVASNTYEKKQKRFQFTSVFAQNIKNNEVWQNSIKNQLKICNEGYNLTILAYGVTGSGKTHTIFGNQLDQGLAIRSFKQIIRMNPNSQFKFSYLQIYNECVRDLLSPHENKILNLLEQNNKIIVPQLRQFDIQKEEQIIELIKFGNQKRALAATHMNQVSSRSHAILQFSIISKKQNQIMSSKLTIIDLAGSQRTFYNQSNKMIIQGSNINKSLLALGNCIKALSQPQKKNSFIPYRDSKLTRLLKQALSGNSRSIMFACINPNPIQYQQTINTIYYASRAYKIKKKLKRNTKKAKLTVCPNCSHQIYTQINQHEQTINKSNNKNIQQNQIRLEYLTEKIEKINIDILKLKFDEMLNQSNLIGKRSSEQGIYDSSILKQVFEINKNEFQEEILKIEKIFQELNKLSLSNKNIKIEKFEHIDKENIDINVYHTNPKNNLYNQNSTFHSYRQSENKKRFQQNEGLTHRNEAGRTLRMKRDLDQNNVNLKQSKKQLIKTKIAIAKQYLIPTCITTTTTINTLRLV